jgi:D-alanyl-D-alanine dipeptidase
LLLETTLQLILVTTPDWQSQTGQMVRFERESLDLPFSEHGTAIPIVVGQKGMAWGIGLHLSQLELPLDRVKREGDRKAPAGIFRLGPIFVDYRFPFPLPFHMPVIEVNEWWEGVDDPSSIYYNQLVDTLTVEGKDWSSSELMQREDELYRLGLVIHHNPVPAIPHYGSCIFMHSWRSESQGTWGCTALAPDALKEVLKWLDDSKSPLLVQLPQEEYQKVREEWSLPNL